MDDLISRQAAIDLVRDVCDAILSECGCHYDLEVEDEVYDDLHEVDTILKCNKEIRKSLKDLPSAQPERKTGRWIKRGSWYCCSECGAEMFFTGVYDEDQHYCYNCGSYNGGGDDEQAD